MSHRHNIGRFYTHLFLTVLLYLGVTYPLASFAYDEKIVDIADNYLQNYKKFQVNFKQIDPDDKTHYGILLIDKPYKFRCNYFEPYPFLIVGSEI